jgi:DNA-binding MarR family transcriptional regulator
MITPQNTTQPALRRFDSPEQEAYLAIWRTYDRLRALEEDVFGPFELTAQQYNLLRLLAADRPAAVPAAKLLARLISKAPDITRMLDRLEARALLTRSRSDEDRRAVLVAITDAGLALLDDIAGPLSDCHDRQLGHLRPGDLQALTTLLQAARAPHEPPGGPWS